MGGKNERKKNIISKSIKETNQKRHRKNEI